ncbi:MAG: hypothetical protein ABIG03_02255 [Candidatus Eisenbacteria bacterium]
MKKALTTLAILILISATAAGQNVSITDYKVPVSSARSLNANLFYNYASKGDTTISDVGTVGLVYKQFYSSLPLSWGVDVSGTGTKLNDDTSHSVDFSTYFNKYLADDGDFFGYAGLAASHVEGYKQIDSRGSVGVGYGRFINATAFARAIRIDQFLLEEGVITGHIPKADLIKLGNVIERRGEFQDEHGSAYKPYWYEKMEDVIRASGKLGGDTLGATGILRMDEVLFDEVIHDRYYGWDVSAGVGHEITTFDESDPEGLVEAGFSFAYPMGLKSQINHRTDYITPFDGMGEAYGITSVTDYIYEVSNRIDFMGSYQLQYDKASADEDAIDGHSIRAGFIFYIENQVNVAVTGQLDKIGDGDWYTNTSVSVGYRVF